MKFDGLAAQDNKKNQLPNKTLLECYSHSLSFFSNTVSKFENKISKSDILEVFS